MSNRLLRTRLVKRLSELEKEGRFPAKPQLSPPILYLQDVLNPENLRWEPTKQERNLNEVIRRVHKHWPSMNSDVKGRAVCELFQYDKCKEAASWLLSVSQSTVHCPLTAQ